MPEQIIERIAGTLAKVNPARLKYEGSYLLGIIESKNHALAPLVQAIGYAGLVLYAIGDIPAEFLWHREETRRQNQHEEITLEITAAA